MSLGFAEPVRACPEHLVSHCPSCSHQGLRRQMCRGLQPGERGGWFPQTDITEPWPWPGRCALTVSHLAGGELGFRAYCARTKASLRERGKDGIQTGWLQSSSP